MACRHCKERKDSLHTILRYVYGKKEKSHFFVMLPQSALKTILNNYSNVQNYLRCNVKLKMGRKFYTKYDHNAVKNSNPCKKKKKKKIERKYT